MYSLQNSLAMTLSLAFIDFYLIADYSSYRFLWDDIEPIRGCKIFSLETKYSHFVNLPMENFLTKDDSELRQCLPILIVILVLFEAIY